MPPAARLSKRDKGVGAEGEQLLLAFEPVGKAPQHGACGGHEDMEALRIADLVRLRRRLERSKLGVRKGRVVGISKMGVGIPAWI